MILSSASRKERESFPGTSLCTRLEEEERPRVSLHQEGEKAEFWPSIREELFWIRFLSGPKGFHVNRSFFGFSGSRGEKPKLMSFQRKWGRRDWPSLDLRESRQKERGDAMMFANWRDRVLASATEKKRRGRRLKEKGGEKRKTPEQPPREGGGEKRQSCSRQSRDFLTKRRPPVCGNPDLPREKRTKLRESAADIHPESPRHRHRSL